MNLPSSLKLMLTLVACANISVTSGTEFAVPSDSSGVQPASLFAQAANFEESKDIARAVGLYQQSYDQAVLKKQEKQAARSAFKLARISQQMAENLEGAERTETLETAERNYHLALKHQPETRAIYNNLAELYRSQGKAEQAEEYFHKALADKIEIAVHLPATERLEIIPAQYETVSEQVVVREASVRKVSIPAQYNTISEKVLVSPHRVQWQKGACADGTVHRVDPDGTENCKIDIPAEYETIRKRVVSAPARERLVTIPAEYRTIERKVVVAAPKTRTVNVPARNIIEVKALKHDGREDLYKANLARLRAEQGDWLQAEMLYKELVISEPQSGKYHLILMNHYQKKNQNPADYLWLLVRNGQVLRAQDSALNALESGNGSNLEREEWLTIFAASLAEVHFNPAKFSQSERGQRLSKLRKDKSIGAAANQLLQLLASRHWESDNYPYWQQGSRFNEPPNGIWPRDAFRLVSRNMAKWYVSNNEIEWAEKCLRMTITFVGDEIDPVAISDLADIYIGQGDIGSVHKLLSDYEVRMFQGKGNAYRNSTLIKILEYHSVLGKIYSYAGDNRQSGRASTALFQLEHAKQVADKLERTADEGRNKPFFTAELAQLLAREYQDQSNNDAAIRVIIDAANQYLKIGDNTTANRLMTVIEDL